MALSSAPAAYRTHALDSSPPLFGRQLLLNRDLNLRKRLVGCRYDSRHSKSE